jgi:hypothetical protein
MSFRAMVIGTYVPMTEPRNLQLSFAPPRRGESRTAWGEPPILNELRQGKSFEELRFITHAPVRRALKVATISRRHPVYDDVGFCQGTL